MKTCIKWLLFCGLILFVAAGLFIAKNYFGCFSCCTKLWSPQSELTFAMIKPDAVQAKNSGKIIDRIESEGFEITAMKKVTLTQKQAEEFYAEHKGKKFFAELVSFMTSGPVVLMALSKENAIKAWRELMGSTNPEQAAPETLRKLYGASMSTNAVHGSDAPESAAREIKLMFPELGK